MMENSLFGLNSGSFMVNYGGENTQFATPSILAQKVAIPALSFMVTLELSGIAIMLINNGAIIIF